MQIRPTFIALLTLAVTSPALQAVEPKADRSLIANLLLDGVKLLATFAPWVPVPPERVEETKAAFAKIGFRYREPRPRPVGFGFGGGTEPLVFQAPARCSDDDLKKLRDLPPIWLAVTLDLGDTTATPEGLKELARVKGLASLVLPSKNLTDAVMKGLIDADLFAKLDQVVPENGVAGGQLLLLGDTTITDGGLKELARVKELTAVSLAGSGVTDAGLKELARCPKLTFLDMTGSQITDAGLKQVVEMKALRTLLLDPDRITPVGLKHLKGTSVRRVGYGQPAVVTDAVLKELRAADKLHTLTVFASGPNPDGPNAPADVQRAMLRGTRVTDAGLSELLVFPNLETIDLTETGVTAVGLKNLNGMKNLRHVEIELKRLTDAWLFEADAANLLHTLSVVGGKDGQRPTNADEVTAVNLSGSAVTDRGLMALAGLKKITQVRLDGTKVTNQGMKAVAGWADLTALSVAGTKVTGKGLAELKGATALTELDLSGTPINDGGLTALKPFAALTTLNLTDTKVTNTGLWELKRFKGLNALYLQGTGATVKGVTNTLGGLPLKTLGLIDTRATAAGVAALQNQFPGCTIVTRRGFETIIIPPPAKSKK